MKITIYLIALIAGSIIGYSILEKSKFESFDIVGQVNKIDPKISPKQTFFNIWDTIASVKVNIKYDAKTDKVNIKHLFEKHHKALNGQKRRLEGFYHKTDAPMLSFKEWKSSINGKSSIHEGPNIVEAIELDSILKINNNSKIELEGTLYLNDSNSDRSSFILKDISIIKIIANKNERPILH